MAISFRKGSKDEINLWLEMTLLGEKMIFFFGYDLCIYLKCYCKYFLLPLKEEFFLP